jgi:hypothetical protein
MFEPQSSLSWTRAYFGRCRCHEEDQELVKTLQEFGEDIDKAVKDHKDGDFEGKSYFGKKG